MPPRDDELPEGTDTIINGAFETGDRSDTGGIGDLGGIGGIGGGTADVSGGTGSGFIGSGATDSTGGTTGTTGIGGFETGGTTETVTGGTVVDQLKNQASSLRGQAGNRVRDFAEGGKARATDALDELSRVVNEAADSIDERLGGDYGGYARRASGAVADFADNLRGKEVDELYDGARNVVRKSPVIALATAAVVGFALVRLVKAGLPARTDADADAGG